MIPANIKYLLGHIEDYKSYKFRSDSVIALYRSPFRMLFKIFFVLSLRLRLLFTGYIIVPNMYPYDNIDKLINNSHELIIFYKKVKPEVALFEGDIMINNSKLINCIIDMVVWENPELMKSIPSIKHLHVLYESG
jgi:hypothetical protein